MLSLQFCVLVFFDGVGAPSSVRSRCSHRIRKVYGSGVFFFLHVGVGEVLLDASWFWLLVRKVYGSILAVTLWNETNLKQKIEKYLKFYDLFLNC